MLCPNLSVQNTPASGFLASGLRTQTGNEFEEFRVGSGGFPLQLLLNQDGSKTFLAGSSLGHGSCGSHNVFESPNAVIVGDLGEVPVGKVECVDRALTVLLESGNLEWVVPSAAKIFLRSNLVGNLVGFFGKSDRFLGGKTTSLGRRSFASVGASALERHIGETALAREGWSQEGNAHIAKEHAC